MTNLPAPVPRYVIVAAALFLASCTPTPPQQAAQPSGTEACKAGTNARGIAAGFFALFQDRPECF